MISNFISILRVKKTLYGAQFNRSRKNILHFFWKYLYRKNITQESFISDNESKIGNDYIENALKDLIPILGVSEFVDHEYILSLIQSKDIKEALKEIASNLGLPIEIKLSYVPKGYNPNRSDFKSTELVKTDWRGKGTSGITAQVSIPANLPFYGTGLVNFPIDVRISENCVENPATLISVMAHELSHIVLYSMRHKDKDNEFYTDLTAMLLGFAKITEIGRTVIKTERFGSWDASGSRVTTVATETTKYGYLSDENFYFALKQIEYELTKRRTKKIDLLNELEKFDRRIKNAKKMCIRFNKYIDYLLENLNQKISQEDGIRIGSFHHSGYSEKLVSVINKNDLSKVDFYRFVDTLWSYTESNMEKIETIRLKLANEDFNKAYLQIQEDVAVLKKYVSTICKLKLEFTLMSSKRTIAIYSKLISKQKLS